MDKINKPYRALVKLIRVIESCKTLGQLDTANKMISNLTSLSWDNCDTDSYYKIFSIYETKLKQLQEKENANSK